MRVRDVRVDGGADVRRVLVGAHEAVVAARGTLGEGLVVVERVGLVRPVDEVLCLARITVKTLNL